MRSDLSFQRFSDGFGLPTDLTVGLDGLLYTLNATVNNTTILVHNPETMALVRALNVAQRLQSVAVDENGNLYAVTDTGLKQYTPDGELVGERAGRQRLGHRRSATTQLLVTTDMRVTRLDTSFATLGVFTLPGSVSENFLSFAAFVQDPAGGVPGGGGIDTACCSPANPGHQLASDRRPAKLFEYTPFGQLVREHDLPGVRVRRGSRYGDRRPGQRAGLQRDVRPG